MNRCALTIAAGPKYWPSVQKTGHDDVHAAHRMHFVVSSKIARWATDWMRSLSGLSLAIRNGWICAVRLEERLHVDDEVLLERKALDRFDVDRLADVEILDQGLAGEPVAAVDAHRVGPADAVRARAAERQRAVLLPLDLVQRVENAVGRVHLHVVVDPARLVVDLGVEAPDDERDGERLEARLDGRVAGFCSRVHSQYFRSIGW